MSRIVQFNELKDSCKYNSTYNKHRHSIERKIEELKLIWRLIEYQQAVFHPTLRDLRLYEDFLLKDFIDKVEHCDKAVVRSYNKR